MSTAFCPRCMADRQTRIEDRRETLPVRGTEVEVDSHVAVCAECGEDVWIDELADETLGRAFEQYRIQHHLLSPTQMARIRARWGLGQRAFSLLLGWGEITLHRYESGSLQDAAHDAQLRMAESPDNVRILLESNGDRLTPKQREALEGRLGEALAERTDDECTDEALEHLLAREAVGPYGGETPLSMAKVRETILYFCELPDMFVTKLAKLMFYADFLHHKEHTTSITGLAYAHLPHGPVPEHYERIRADVLENGLVHVEERCGSDWSGEVLVADKSPDLAVFSADEVAVLDAVATRLGKSSSLSLSNRAHAESAYRSTSLGCRIPYSAASELTLTL